MRALALAFAALLCGVTAPVRAAEPPHADLTPCHVAGADEVARCARVEVPEDWARPSGRRIGLHVVLLPMTGPGPEQPPLLWAEGGPGVPGTGGAALYATELRFYRDRRAVILFDQRGTGESAPLHCPATEQRSRLDDMYPPGRAAACRRELEQRADLSQYTTVAAARDMEAIRAALGYDKVDLGALSYGTFLAQAYIKLYPQHVRAAVLIGTVPLGEKLPLHHAANGEAALRQLFADCAAEAACHAAYPDLARDWSRLMARLGRSPQRVTGPDGKTVLVRTGPLGEAVRAMLNTQSGRLPLPRAIGEAGRGDLGPLLKAVTGLGPEIEADGLYLSVTCPEATRRITPAEITRAVAGTSFGRYRIDQQLRACREWAPGRADPALLTPLRSDVPVLLLAGGRDATTPVAWARQVAAGLPRGRVVVIPALTHFPDGLSNMMCLDRLILGVLNTGSTDDLDTGCVASMSPPPFPLRR